ncbi:hypothetical protein PMAYCL1PPCAC_33190, partial [Pristionchus mayeri]
LLLALPLVACRNSHEDSREDKHSHSHDKSDEEKVLVGDDAFSGPTPFDIHHRPHPQRIHGYPQQPYNPAGPYGNPQGSYGGASQGSYGPPGYQPESPRGDYGHPAYPSYPVNGPTYGGSDQQYPVPAAQPVPSYPDGPQYPVPASQPVPSYP